VGSGQQDRRLRSFSSSEPVGRGVGNRRNRVPSRFLRRQRRVTATEERRGDARAGRFEPVVSAARHAFMRLGETPDASDATPRREAARNSGWRSCDDPFSEERTADPDLTPNTSRCPGAEDRDLPSEVYGLRSRSESAV
jgi:hypothetical protein